VTAAVGDRIGTVMSSDALLLSTESRPGLIHF
jgi:hypothetical protein